MPLCSGARGGAIRPLVSPWRAARGAVRLVILPEIIPAQWWQNLLHNQRALLIQAALLFKPGVIVTAVPYHLAQ
jgi:hypothetical protein